MNPGYLLRDSCSQWWLWSLTSGEEVNLQSRGEDEGLHKEAAFQGTSYEEKAGMYWHRQEIQEGVAWLSCSFGASMEMTEWESCRKKRKSESKRKSPVVTFELNIFKWPSSSLFSSGICLLDRCHLTENKLWFLTWCS